MAVGIALSAMAFHTDTIQIRTKYLPKPDSVIVILPNAAKGRPCPTVYLLNGYSGNHKSWTQIRPNLGRYADLYGMILVMPDGQDSWYWDSPINPKMQMETFIIHELIPYIDTHYPTINKRQQRAIAGLSMGGQGAFWLAGRYPELFGSAAAISGGVDIRHFKARWGMKKLLGDPIRYKDNWETHTVANMIQEFKDAKLNLSIDCGTDDFFYEVNANLHKAFLEAQIPHDYTARPGGHTFEYWNNAILYQLLFFNEAFTRK